jgi:hypothetical protein
MLKMEIKDIIIILLGAIIVFGVGAYAITNIDFSTEPETKVYDFEAFSMNISANSSFIKNNTTDSYKKEYIDNVNNITVTIIDTTNLEGYEYAAGFKLGNAVNERVEPEQEVTTKGVAFFQTYTEYSAIYNPDGLFIIIKADTLEELVQMVNTIIIKNLTSEQSNETSDSSSSSKSNPSSSSSESDIEKLRRENAEADARQICPSCGVYTGTEGKYCPSCWERTFGTEYQGGMNY